MNIRPSYDDLATWDDLNTLVQENDIDDADDPKKLDPRELPEDIIQLDKSIAHLEEQLADLKLQRAKRLDERALISRLPPELLSHVFDSMSADESVDLLPVLSLVSRSWRDVVLTTPWLWTYIILDSQWAWRMPNFLRRLRIQLQRSQASKLYVDLDLCHVDNTADIEMILSELELHLPRCYSFTVSVPDWSTMRVVHEHASGLGLALEELYLKIDSSESETHELSSVLSQPCPRLVNVVLEHTPLDCVKTPMPALRQIYLLRDHRCHSTTRITYPFRDFMKIIKSGSTEYITLQSAVFSLDTAEDIFRSSPAAHELPLVRGATFDAVDAETVSLFLESASLPTLEILSVNSGEDVQWLTRISLSPGRFPALRLLDLRNCNFNGPALVPLIRALHQLPQITGLGIAAPVAGVVGTRMFDMLASGPDILGEWLLPRLEALCFQSCRDISGHEILPVILARRGAAGSQVANIVFLKITQSYLLDQEMLERLITLVDTVRTD